MSVKVPEKRIKGGTVIGFVEEEKPTPAKTEDEPKPKKSAK